MDSARKDSPRVFYFLEGTEMLVLSRKKNEQIVITVGGETITFVVAEIRGDKVKIGFDAPPEVTIHRLEVQEAIDSRYGDSTPPQVIG